jgi:hypothetical protein
MTPNSTSQVCYEITSGTMGGWNCGNMPSRNLILNDTTYVNGAGCGSPASPTKRNGGYCFVFAPGDYAWAWADPY